ncbi:hypothetical protein C8J57DRAFT_1531197 [Mycena rebaudengoi]|nr:hypothetical protein C8J57DRAFT_1531197 [Mycena rebaudengoi]
MDPEEPARPHKLLACGTAFRSRRCRRRRPHHIYDYGPDMQPPHAPDALPALDARILRPCFSLHLPLRFGARCPTALTTMIECTTAVLLSMSNSVTAADFILSPLHTLKTASCAPPMSPRASSSPLSLPLTPPHSPLLQKRCLYRAGRTGVAVALAQEKKGLCTQDFEADSPT